MIVEWRQHMEIYLSFLMHDTMNANADNGAERGRRGGFSHWSEVEEKVEEIVARRERERWE
jgi:hypothetical protein